MTTQSLGFVQTQKPAFSLERFIAALFAVELREAVAKDTSSSQSDAPYIWGL